MDQGIRTGLAGPGPRLGADTERPPRGEWRQFGLVTGSLLVLLFGLAIPWLRGRTFPGWPWAVGAALIGSGALYPPALRYPFAIWSAAGKALGWVNSRLMLALLFYLVVTPMGLLMRLVRRDPMARKFEPGAATYRVASRNPPIKNIERPF